MTKTYPVTHSLKIMVMVCPDCEGIIADELTAH